MEREWTTGTPAGGTGRDPAHDARLGLVRHHEVERTRAQPSADTDDAAGVTIRAWRTDEVRLDLDGQPELLACELGVRVRADDDDVLGVVEGGDEIAHPLLGSPTAVSRDHVEHPHRAGWFGHRRQLADTPVARGT